MAEHTRQTLAELATLTIDIGDTVYVVDTNKKYELESTGAALDGTEIVDAPAAQSAFNDPNLRFTNVASAGGGGGGGISGPLENVLWVSASNGDAGGTNGIFDTVANALIFRNAQPGPTIYIIEVWNDDATGGTMAGETVIRGRGSKVRLTGSFLGSDSGGTIPFFEDIDFRGVLTFVSGAVVFRNCNLTGATIDTENGTTQIIDSLIQGGTFDFYANDLIVGSLVIGTTVKTFPTYTGNFFGSDFAGVSFEAQTGAAHIVGFLTCSLIGSTLKGTGANATFEIRNGSIFNVDTFDGAQSFDMRVENCGIKQFNLYHNAPAFLLVSDCSMSIATIKASYTGIAPRFVNCNVGSLVDEVGVASSFEHCSIESTTLKAGSFKSCVLNAITFDGGTDLLTFQNSTVESCIFAGTSSHPVLAENCTVKSGTFEQEPNSEMRFRNCHFEGNEFTANYNQTAGATTRFSNCFLVGNTNNAGANLSDVYDTEASAFA